MRVLIDANVFLSYISTPAEPRVVTSVITTCLTAEEIDLLIPPEQISEISATITTKRYFRERIPRTLVDNVVEQIKALGELHPLLDEMASFCRDPKDDYLVAYGIVNEADNLITGDPDLLFLDRVGVLQNLTPAAFLEVSRRLNLLPWIHRIKPTQDEIGVVLRPPFHEPICPYSIVQGQ